MRNLTPSLPVVVTLLATAGVGCKDEFPVPSVPPVSTQPLAPPSLAGPELPCEPPHHGQLYLIGEQHGHVEWDAAAGRLYWLDPACGPLKGVEHVVCYVKTPSGPRRLELQDCRDDQYPGACRSAPGDRLRDADAPLVLRFMLNGEGYRVLLGGTEPDNRPADILRVIDTQPGP